MNPVEARTAPSGAAPPRARGDEPFAWYRQGEAMSDKIAVITAVVAGTAVLLTVTVALHNSTTQQIEALQTSTNHQIDALSQSLGTRIDDLNTSVNRRIDELGDRVDDLAERTTKLENDVRELRTLLVDRVLGGAQP